MRTPDGQAVKLPGRGTTFVRDVAGPPGAPTVVLLHGLGATARLNWPGAFEALSPSFRVVGLDHRGHGRGIRSQWRFRLRDCADDIVALADELGIEQFIAVGYSMGGPIALQARRRHPERVSGLVLCATAARFAPDDDRRSSPVSNAVATSLRLTPPAVRRRMADSAISYLARETAMPPAFLDETRNHDPAAIVEASQSIRAFDARRWLSELSCPAVSIVTDRDRLVPISRQIELAHGVDARIIPLAAGHEVAVTSPGRFLPALLAACRDVAARVDRRAAG
jgi:pimeloyl-ACP methyl ester carboxylesterase